jgi:hypothetical protein
VIGSAGFACSVCGEWYVPARSAADYGSAACRQGASRTGPVTGIRPLGVDEAGVGA